ncbi:MAG TPA: hypothetical protein VKP65_11425 [Rhodothermales bacterium]|nr:hypothetical protein [Rhodothermales bacterium]
MTGCDTLGFGGSCSGAEGLRAEHDSLLACAGWRDFVYDNIRNVEYVETFDLDPEPDKEVTGQARCRSCQVRVAELVWQGGDSSPQLRLSSELAAILVHEAAHLEDGCKNGEAPADSAEAAFLRDLGAKFPNGFIERPGMP